MLQGNSDLNSWKSDITYNKCSENAYELFELLTTKEAIGKRELKTVVMGMIAEIEDEE